MVCYGRAGELQRRATADPVTPTPTIIAATPDSRPRKPCVCSAPLEKKSMRGATRTRRPAGRPRREDRQTSHVGLHLRGASDHDPRGDSCGRGSWDENEPAGGLSDQDDYRVFPKPTRTTLSNSAATPASRSDGRFPDYDHDEGRMRKVVAPHQNLHAVPVRLRAASTCSAVRPAVSSRCRCSPLIEDRIGVRGATPR